MVGIDDTDVLCRYISGTGRYRDNTNPWHNLFAIWSYEWWVWSSTIRGFGYLPRHHCAAFKCNSGLTRIYMGTDIGGHFTRDRAFISSEMGGTNLWQLYRNALNICSPHYCKCSSTGLHIIVAILSWLHPYFQLIASAETQQERFLFRDILICFLESVYGLHFLTIPLSSCILRL